MRIFDSYLLKNLFVATLFIAVTLTAVVFLTQSLRFLELVIDTGASSLTFWILTSLALPRFFEMILPLALLAATIFIYNKMSLDSEIVAIRSAGFSPMSLARPAILLALIGCVFLWGVTMWIAPLSLSSMQKMRQVVKAQYSSLLVREGVFNAVSPGLTVYVRERGAEGDLMGLMIHDSREKNKNPSTIMAKRGMLTFTDDGNQVLVYDGIRQEHDKDSGALHRLNFERYTIDLPDDGPVRQRWREPDERTIGELIHPDLDNERDVESLRDFHVEIHRRVISPVLALTFTMMALASMLIGPTDRRGQSLKIMVAVGSGVLIQALYLGAFNLSRQSDLGLLLMYVLVLAPMGVSAFLLNGASETLRRRLLYRTSEI